MLSPLGDTGGDHAAGRRAFPSYPTPSPPLDLSSGKARAAMTAAGLSLSLLRRRQFGGKEQQDPEGVSVSTATVEAQHPRDEGVPYGCSSELRSCSRPRWAWEGLRSWNHGCRLTRWSLTTPAARHHLMPVMPVAVHAPLGWILTIQPLFLPNKGGGPRVPLMLR